MLTVSELSSEVIASMNPPTARRQVLLVVSIWCGLLFSCGLMGGQTGSAQVTGEHEIDETRPSISLDNLVDWPAFLKQCDWHRDTMSRSWDEAPFMGNGEQGTLVYQVDDRTVRFDVGCSAAHDHRPWQDDDLSEKHVEVLNRGRHFIGHLELRLPADISGGASRIGLWNAEASGTIQAAEGDAKWTAIAHATEPVIHCELQTTGELNNAKFVYVPTLAKSPRAVRAKAERKASHPTPKIIETDDGIQLVVQDLVAGGQTAVAWTTQRDADRTQLWLSVQHSFPESDASDRVVAAVRSAMSADHESWIGSHREWWHNYYSQSFLQTGDPFWDSFYWIQQYKLACVTRDRGWIIDNQGPWLQPTAWSATWWNLNVQLSHAGGYTANRRGTVSALRQKLHDNQESLIENVAEPYRHDSSAIGRSSSGWDLIAHAGQPGGRPEMDPKIGAECANLLWALHNVDLEYRYWADDSIRDETLYPLLTRAVNYYRHFLERDVDGTLHLPRTFSPEYRLAEDCTYDLDLLRWGIDRLIELAEEKQLSVEDEPLLPTWRDLSQNLVAVQTNETGRAVGRDVWLTNGHRHWSHLMAIYPLRTITPDSEENRELIERSLNHWRSFGRGIAGYSYTASSCMASLLGDGDSALEYLEKLRPYLRPNTFYSEIGLPVMETPLHGATAMQEMMLQSHGGKLAVFPAVPARWPDVKMVRYRGEGGYLVSGRMEAGQCRWVLIESTVGGDVDVLLPPGTYKWSKNDSPATVRDASDALPLQTVKGDQLLVWLADKPVRVK
ncbi:glycosyl hydrolase family 95 catalytic domain-containing protein [Rhodopirellula baltica]|uniref:Glycosyl hydrolase family 95 catalytic domain-containing protein n=1 Tax=Rhodopirellula baltica SWK14 TaxID=993516 RepID=L7CPV2_RHOBT|nr:hypothetical protein [Rhodopirellula baltica]ELP35677.1 hypothetical protein RBSWK_00387 [Rhodopirellula baltica SWK14]